MCEMIGKYGPGYRPPSYHDIREKLLKQAVQKTDDSLQEFRDEWKRTGCSIMSYGWTDKKRRSICNFLVNSPKGTIFLYSLDTSDISKTTDKVFKMLDDVVKFVGEENVVQVITDNAANFKAAGELLMHTRPHLYWTPCAAHCIDMILEDLEKHLKEGRKVEDSVLDNRFWKNVSICLKAAAPLMVVLRLVDSDQQPAMGFIYVEMDCAKERIKSNFNNVKKKKTMPPVEWWEMFGDGCPELKWFAIRVLSLTCSSSGCERNWSSFEMVHTKRRNRLHQKKMNDLVYVMYNLKLKSRQTRKTVALPFEDMESDDEWITQEGDDIFDEDNFQVEQEQPLGESGSGSNVDLVGGSLTDPTLVAFDIDNLVLNDNVEDDFSTEEELENDGDENDGGGDDIGDDFIR
ncbi:hypothetical protein D0Y65_053162 [Glycine soja]|uniref:DUF659 domain-containing protein n=1 Tax=Glycine soja TaxID=3848 RepID=A0A445F0W3_GLYSO|nr:hypothetical protein D0Y65_053162 [Glycine soja]